MGAVGPTAATRATVLVGGGAPPREVVDVCGPGEQAESARKERQKKTKKERPRNL